MEQIKAYRSLNGKIYEDPNECYEKDKEHRLNLKNVKAYNMFLRIMASYHKYDEAHAAMLSGRWLQIMNELNKIYEE